MSHVPILCSSSPLANNNVWTLEQCQLYFWPLEASVLSRLSSLSSCYYLVSLCHLPVNTHGVAEQALCLLLQKGDFIHWHLPPPPTPAHTPHQIHITQEGKGQEEIIPALDSSINFLPIFNLAFNLISFMTLILSTYVLQDIVSLESPWICSIVPELNEWILSFWFHFTLCLILTMYQPALHESKRCHSEVT